MQLPPLILIHGYPFDHSLWNLVIAHLEGKTKILAPDLPGFGENPTKNSEPSIDLMADDVAALLDRLQIKKAVVAGMSLGGYVALAFAQRHRDRLVGLGLISTQPTADSTEAKQARRALIQAIKSDGIEPALGLLPKLFAATNPERPELEIFAKDGAKKAGVNGLAWALEAMAQRPDRSELLPNLKIPSLVFHGEEDQIIPVEKARQFAETIPGGKFISVPGVGHATPLESPQQLAEALLNLLECVQKESDKDPIRKHAESLPGITWSPTESGL